MKNKFILIILISVLIITTFFFIEKRPYTVTFYEASTEEPFTNATTEVIYTKFCPSSPCGHKYQSRTIFSGITDETGKVRLWGHSAKDIGRPGQWDRIIEYHININGETYKYMDKDKSDKTKVYLISKE